MDRNSGMKYVGSITGEITQRLIQDDSECGSIDDPN